MRRQQKSAGAATRQFGWRLRICSGTVDYALEVHRGLVWPLRECRRIPGRGHLDLGRWVIALEQSVAEAPSEARGLLKIIVAATREALLVIARDRRVALANRADCRMTREAWFARIWFADKYPLSDKEEKQYAKQEAIQKY